MLNNLYFLRGQFYHATREDAEISFIKPLVGLARFELADLPSVRKVEMFRAVSARLRFGHRSRRVGLLGLEKKREFAKNRG